jgi:hypothetical protein
MLMSQPDPPAPDLGAIRGRLEAHAIWLDEMRTTLDSPKIAEDILGMLAAYDAQAARLAAVGPVLRAYREQHDICAADPDEGIDRCPCEICDAAVAAGAVGAREATDGSARDVD